MLATAIVVSALSVHFRRVNIATAWLSMAALTLALISASMSLPSTSYINRHHQHRTTGCCSWHSNHSIVFQWSHCQPSMISQHASDCQSIDGCPAQPVAQARTWTSAEPAMAAHSDQQHTNKNLNINDLTNKTESSWTNTVNETEFTKVRRVWCVLI